ncbi:hypothetical protein [Psychrobacter sp. FDAARGOS_221]|uniref:hypothetical protein n=1 Tax=Psychrobacter sp. FDAARGOS_221 TaxID=1975705 RepID=UPI000FD8D20F|nr:hypothetical protein [Psychrobacter sp. FDAARGOS_221]
MLNTKSRLFPKLHAISLAIMFALPVGALATVGGGQRIEVLGYEARDNKVYVLRHFDDARGRLPQLYYYDLDTQFPQNLIEVRSLYINPNTKQFDEFDDKGVFFEHRLNRIKQRLTSLEPEYVATSIKVNSLTQRRAKLSSWLGPINSSGDEASDETYYEYQFNYQLATDKGDYRSATQTTTTYSVCLLDDDVIYTIPNQPYALSTVNYMGTLMEGGYQYQDAVLLKQQTAEKQ